MTTRSKIIIISGIALVTLATFVLWPDGEGTAPIAAEVVPVVTTTTAGQFTGQSTVSLIGTVRAFSEAAITAEQSGRATSVPVKLGQEVRAGQVIATQENASQQAAVLQAEGSYEAALAAAAQNEIGTTEAATQITVAEDRIEAALANAFTTVNGAIRVNVDQFFDNPDSFTPSLLISGQGNAATLQDFRTSYRTSLSEWRNRINNLTNQSDFETERTHAKSEIARTIAFIDVFITVFAEQDNQDTYSAAELASFGATFNSVRSSLVQASANLDSSFTSLESANEALKRAELAASGSQNSAADAQVKQALGGLRAAQANLAKTILRSPISGTVNNLSIRTGDFIGAQQQVAEVANNNALEIVTAIGEKERDAFAIGDTVQIEGDLDGSVTEIAPAITAGTGKIEVRIAAESTDLKNGDTVTIARVAATSSDSRAFVPLSAVKFEQTDGVVFLVEDDILVAKSVTLGIVRGGSVEVLSGLTNDEPFVTDARGLQSGTKVTVIN